MKLLRKEQLVRSKSCHFYFLPIVLLQSIEFLSINEPAMENRCLCSFNAPSRFTLNENCNWIGFFQTAAHQWIKFLYQASEVQKWILIPPPLKTNPTLGAYIIWNSNLVFVLLISSWIKSQKGFFHDHEILSFKKTIAKTLISFQKTILTRDLFGESSLTLDIIRSSASELESERTQASDITKVKVWNKFISAVDMLLWRRISLWDWT